MIKKPFQKHARDWLNGLDSYDTGSIQHSVSVDTYGDAPSYVDADLSIRDCSRSISLSFCFSEEEKYKERIKKIDLLLKHLNDFRTGMMEAAKICRPEWKRIIKEKEEKEDEQGVCSG